jgi:hypothetical protein
MIAGFLTSARRAASACLGPSLALLVLAPAARADSAVFVDVSDNTLYETSAGNLSNGSGPTMFAGRTTDPINSRRRALVRFALPGPIPAGSIVISATLQLSCVVSASNGPTNLYRAENSWGEGPSIAGSASDPYDIYPGDEGAPAQTPDATWTDRFYPGQPWLTAGGDIGPFDGGVATTPVGNVTISGSGLVNAVASWLNSPTLNFGWFLVGDESKPGTENGFRTREGGGANFLTVVYSPPPTAARAGTWGRVKAIYR